MSAKRAVFLLEDGTAFEGAAFGAEGKATGEAVFYTGVVGYQEVLTNPSYRGTLLVLTYPIIGSYGVNAEDNESAAAQPRGVVVRDYSAHYSNFRATGSLDDFLRERGVVGIQGVDTRAVAVHLRDHGEMKAAIVPADADRAAALAALRSRPSPFASDLVAELPAAAPLEPAGPVQQSVGVLDLGASRSLLAQLAQIGCAVRLLPPTATPKDVHASSVGAVIVAGGPGDPRVLRSAILTVKNLLSGVRILGIGLGHQVLALALGCGIARMKPGHHGVNYPVRDLVQGRCLITAQHHSFVVDKEAVAKGAEVTHVNVNDGTVEGIRSEAHPAASVQFHPSRDEMGRPSSILEEFVTGAR